MAMSLTVDAGSILDPLALEDPRAADARLEAGIAFAGLQLPAAPEPAPLGVCVRQAGVADLLAAYAHGSLTPSLAFHELKQAIGSTRAGREAVLRLVEGIDEEIAESDRRWQAKDPRPLEGVFFGVKDIIDVAGTLSTSGSHLTGNRIAPADADCVARLRAAGAIPLAMLATTEFACGSPQNPRFGTVTNPWDCARWTGGSSTGSGAALAARLLPLALGTDTGGSIRVPSCWCGTTGLKPTRELVSRAGVAPLSWTLDHVGPMARSAEDIAHVLPHMTANSALPAPPANRTLRLGIPSNWFTDCVDASVLANWRGALAVLEADGCILVDLPYLDIAPIHAAGWTILLSELAAYHGGRIDQADRFDPGLLARLRQGMRISAATYGEALRHRAAAQKSVLDLFPMIDLIVTPGLGGEAGWLDTLTVEIDDMALPFQQAISRNTMVFDCLGLPALMLPSGLGRHGLPTAMQIIGPPGGDSLCLSLGIRYQSLTEHHRLTPPNIAA
ncbi:amidase [Rhizobium sp. CSW-27]|nr:amidase [Rhizobium sp. CSW-27]